MTLIWPTATRRNGRSPLIASLMALEKWFYEQLEAQKPIDSAIDEILRRTRTVAFIGLLNAIGCKQPSLFFGPLRPLLSVAEFHDWEIRRSCRSLRGLASMGWSQTELARLAREWHDLAHRQKNMHDEAWYLMIRDARTRPHFRGVCTTAASGFALADVSDEYEQAMRSFPVP
jgi:hypothetical protein